MTFNYEYALQSLAKEGSALMHRSDAPISRSSPMERDCKAATQGQHSAIKINSSGKDRFLCETDDRPGKWWFEAGPDTDTLAP